MAIGKNSVKDSVSQLTGNKISSQAFIACNFRIFFCLGGLWCFGVIFFKMSFEFKPSSTFSDVTLLLPPFPCNDIITPN